ncbi:MAG: FAD-dependent monooxygenase [Clostridia bacterium]|nr:FAD-dependent monooxygenase [Clostridia bacterium]
MLRIGNLTMPPDYTPADLPSAVAARLRIPAKDVLSVRLVRRSVDARDKADVHFVLTVDAEVRGEHALLKHLKPGIASPAPREGHPAIPAARLPRRPVVVGAGPAGLFCALILAMAGARPILVERGKAVEDRTRDVRALQTEARLDPESNVQFGEGGAGAFSDGKLTTGTKSPWQRFVLETFVRNGAPEEILWLAKPHIGTDRLKGTIASLRGEILSLGGEVRFSTRLTRLETRAGAVTGVHLEGPEGAGLLETDHVFLCIGHSARDTLQQLFLDGVRMVQKPFAIGVRIEHPQALIDRARYGCFAGHPALGAAEYKLNVHTPDGRGVYSFCMCPGGEVIASASQEGGVVTNGMSLHARDGVNANAALLVGVGPADFGDDHPLAGFVLQRRIEKAAFRAGGGGFRAPVQTVGDFLAERETRVLGSVEPTYRPGVTPADLRAVLPDAVIRDLRYALPRMNGMLNGFAHPDALLTGAETRSSSPVRLPRGQDGCAVGLAGLYPCGEGAGYAGGIMSAATDGIEAAVRLMHQCETL